jgi:ribosomal protein S18 acetylase RimI-like enzyme
VRIRPYEPPDRAACERLMDDFGAELASMDPHGRVIAAAGMGPHALRRMLRRAAENEGLVVVAEGEDGKVVGFASGEVYRREPDERFEVIDYVNGEVTELYVAPSARRHGVATALLAALDDHFKEAGCGVVRIEVFAPNAAARAFYARLGYEERDLAVFRSLDPEGGRP